MAIKRMKQSDISEAKGRSDFKRVDELTEEEIEEAARNDPDSARPTEAELEKFKPARKPTMRE